MVAMRSDEERKLVVYKIQNSPVDLSHKHTTVIQSPLLSFTYILIIPEAGFLPQYFLLT